MSNIAEKLIKLQKNLKSYKKIAVAFSGGIDSTFLLYHAIDSLGGENVVVLSCVSAVNSATGLKNMRRVFDHHFSDNASLREIELSPLSWEEFVPNDSKRCYYCKKRMYSILLEEIKKDSISVLADGTNIDDLQGDRPGLLAIRELGIKTPLVDAGLAKDEIRNVAKEIGLSNYNLPSNSCLATRIPEGNIITKDRLRLVEKSEACLHQLGFTGCRVRVRDCNALIVIQDQDFDRVAQNEVRNAILNSFCGLGFKEVSLSLTCR